MFEQFDRYDNNYSQHYAMIFIDVSWGELSPVCPVAPQKWNNTLSNVFFLLTLLY